MLLAFSRKQNISLILFLLLNLLFGIRYISRVTEFYGIVSLLLTALLLLLWHKRDIFQQRSRYLRYLNILVLLGFVISSFFVFRSVSVDSLNVDRWSVITSFWETYFSGEYPYYAKSNVGNEPGPMPFYFILALPFYLLGELGYFSILGIFVFVAILRHSSVPIHLRTIAILLILGSLFHLWEIICRSNIFLNSCLALVVTIKMIENLKPTTVRLFFLGILIGLVMSTRNVFVIPLIIATIFLLKNNALKLSKLLVLGATALTTFILTFLPFIIGHFNDFFIMNPFIIQSSFLVPFHYTVIFIGLAVLAGILSVSSLDVYFYSSITLFASIAIYFLYHIINFGFEVAFVDGQADISYYILAIPFALYHVVKVEADRLESHFVKHTE